MRKYLFIFSLILASSMATFAQKTLKAGQILPNLALLGTNDVIYNLDEQRGVKGFILVFMTPTCDHCRAYEKRVKALHQKYKQKKYNLVAIGPYGDDPVKFPLDALPEMKKLAQTNGFQFPYLSDSHFKYTWLLGIKTTPTAVVLQKVAKGYLIKYIGPIDDQQNEKLVPKRKYVEQVVDKLV